MFYFVENIGAELTGPSRLGRLPVRADVVTGDSADLVHLDWSVEWQG